MFDTATLDGSSVVTYGATPDEKYGYEANAAGLTARPAVVDKPTGSGHAVLFGFNPFYRSWKEQDERLVLNAALYPKGAVIGGRRADAGVRRARSDGGRDRPGGGAGRQGRAAQGGREGAGAGQGRLEGRPRRPHPGQARRRRQAQGGREGGQPEQVAQARS